MAFSHRAVLRSSRRYALLQQWQAWVLLGLGLTVAASYIPTRLTIARWQAPTPQAILTLGGRPAREAFTAEFAQVHPELKVWVSSGLLPEKARPLFRSHGVADDRVTLDYRALDTVTNFTSLVKDLERQNIRHIYLVTSDYHMQRAEAIATIVLGSHGIAFTPIAVPSTHPKEDSSRTVRDVGRSLLWLVTGYTGADWKTE